MDRYEAMRRAREKRGWTQLQLAEKSGISNRMVSKLERGEREGTITTIELLADAIGISIDEYVGHEVPRWLP